MTDETRPVIGGIGAERKGIGEENKKGGVFRIEGLKLGEIDEDGGDDDFDESFEETKRMGSRKREKDHEKKKIKTGRNERERDVASLNAAAVAESARPTENFEVVGEKLPEPVKAEIKETPKPEEIEFVWYAGIGRDLAASSKWINESDVNTA